MVQITISGSIFYYWPMSGLITTDKQGNNFINPNHLTTEQRNFISEFLKGYKS